MYVGQYLKYDPRYVHIHVCSQSSPLCFIYHLFCDLKDVMIKKKENQHDKLVISMKGGFDNVKFYYLTRSDFNFHSITAAKEGSHFTSLLLLLLPLFLPSFSVLLDE